MSRLYVVPATTAQVPPTTTTRTPILQSSTSGNTTNDLEDRNVTLRRISQTAITSFKIFADYDQGTRVL